MTKKPSAILKNKKIQKLCQSRHIKKLELFGSAARGELKEKSDIDLLVEFFPEAKVSLLDIVRIEDELSEIIGRKVDLVTKDELSPYIRGEILQGALPIYET